MIFIFLHCSITTVAIYYVYFVTITITVTVLSNPIVFLVHLYGLTLFIFFSHYNSLSMILQLLLYCCNYYTFNYYNYNDCYTIFKAYYHCNTVHTFVSYLLTISLSYHYNYKNHYFYNVTITITVQTLTFTITVIFISNTMFFYYVGSLRVINCYYWLSRITKIWCLLYTIK